MCLGGCADIVVHYNQREKTCSAAPNCPQISRLRLTWTCLRCDKKQNHCQSDLGVPYPPFNFPSYMGIHDRRRRPRWVDSLFNLKQLIRLATTQDNKSQKSQRKREKGEGGVFRYFSSSHKGLLVWVTPARWRTDSVSPALLSSLLFWTALHRCASDQKCRPLLQPSRRAPSSQHKKVFPPRLSLTLRTGDWGKSEESIY